MSDPSPMSGPPAAVLHQPGFNLHADQGDKILATMITLIVLASTFVGLRLTSRRLARAGFWWDDYLMVMALLFAIGPCICSIVAVKHVGLGKHIYVFGGRNGAREAASGFFHILYFFQVFFALATGTTKLTTLAFYRRIFPVAELKPVLMIMTTVVVMYTTAVSLTLLFQCRPIRKFWLPEQPGLCINPLNDLIVAGSVNTLLDFVIVCLPVPLLWHLRTSARQRGILTGIFLTAGFVCIVSIFRIVVFTQADHDDITWNFVGVTTWSAVEPIAGILGACLPSLRPLITLLISTTTYRSLTSASFRAFQASTSSVALNNNNQFKPNDRDPTTFTRLDQLEANAKTQRPPWQDQKAPRVYSGENQDGHSITVFGGRNGQSARGDEGDMMETGSLSDAEPPKGVIRVKTEIFWSSSKRLDYNDRLY